MVDRRGGEGELAVAGASEGQPTTQAARRRRPVSESIEATDPSKTQVWRTVSSPPESTEASTTLTPSTRPPCSRRHTYSSDGEAPPVLRRTHGRGLASQQDLLGIIRNQLSDETCEFDLTPLSREISTLSLRSNSLDEAITAAWGREEARPLPAHPHYTFTEELCRGTFATVWKAVDTRVNKVVVVKGVSKLASHLARPRGVDGAGPMNEESILGHLIHPRIVRLFGTPQLDNFLYAIATEYCDGGDLFDAVAAPEFEMDRGQQWLLQLAEALQFVHEQGFAHNDVKMENVLLTDSMASIKLCDFGLAGVAGDRRVGVVEGTTEYMAPELVAVRAGQLYTVSTSADVFAFGVVIHAAIFSFMPWSVAAPDDNNYRKFQSGPEAWNSDHSYLTALHPDLRECLRRMLEVQSRRVAIDDVIPVLSGEWFSDV